MKHAGKARQAGLKLIILSLLIVVLVVGVWSVLAGTVLTAAALVLAGAWLVFLFFTLGFFRDPEPVVPADPRAIVSPAHGTVDLIEESAEKQFLGGPCRRISIFLSILDVHIQNAPVTGQVRVLKHCPGQFLNAMRTNCGDVNENVFIGFESSESPGERVGVRLIAGLLARRIIPWLAEGELVTKGERISLIQFGSRVDLYLPLSARIEVKLRDKVKGGETVLARRT